MPSQSCHGHPHHAIPIHLTCHASPGGAGAVHFDGKQYMSRFSVLPRLSIHQSSFENVSSMLGTIGAYSCTMHISESSFAQCSAQSSGSVLTAFYVKIVNVSDTRMTKNTAAGTPEVAIHPFTNPGSSHPFHLRPSRTPDPRPSSPPGPGCVPHVYTPPDPSCNTDLDTPNSRVVAQRALAQVRAMLQSFF